MISFIATAINDVFVIDNFSSDDERGKFVKTYNTDKLRDAGFDIVIKESYYSQSTKDVIRGMHFQVPPHDHEKLIYVTQGQILDVILDIRKESKSYGKCMAVIVNEFEKSVLIPKGCAHGFLTLTETATVVYMVSSVYNPSSDSGILWNSFGFDWKVKDPILSERDRSFVQFSKFETPFL